MSAPPSCVEAAELIPWLANGTLPRPQATELETHLETCPACQRDLESQRRLCEAMRAPDALAFAAEPSFQKLLDRLEAQGTPPGAAPAQALRAAPALAAGSAPAAAFAERAGRRRHAPPALTRWLTAAVIVQALALATSAWFWHARGSPVRDGAYVTLTSPAAHWSAERVRVLFRQDMSLDELARLLHGIDARVVDGPSQANVYTLGFRSAAGEASQRDARLAALRASPAVLFAEPVARNTD